MERIAKALYTVQVPFDLALDGQSLVARRPYMISKFGTRLSFVILCGQGSFMNVKAEGEGEREDRNSV